MIFLDLFCLLKLMLPVLYRRVMGELCSTYTTESALKMYGYEFQTPTTTGTALSVELWLSYGRMTLPSHTRLKTCLT